MALVALALDAMSRFRVSLLLDEAAAEDAARLLHRELVEREPVTTTGA